MPDASQPPTVLLERAKAGESDALDRLLELYRNYLRLLARTQIDPNLRVRLDASDLVQETLMEACRDFAQFNGITERELMGWLRSIMARNLANLAKHHRAKKRDVTQQQSLEDQLVRSSLKINRVLADQLSSPSARAERRERAAILADALAQLPEDYREVIVMRHFDEAKFPEIAQKLGRSTGAVRMLWVRALERLRVELENLL